MPITLNTNKLNIKNSAGEYVTLDAVADATTAEKVQQINNAGAAQVTAVQQKGAETLATIPNDYTELSTKVTDLKSQISDIASPSYEILTGTKTTGKTIPSTATVSDAAAAYYVTAYSVQPGDRLRISGCASNYGYVYIFVDGNGDTVGRSDQNSSGMHNYSDLMDYAPALATTLYVASHSSESYTQAKAELVTYKTTGLDEVTERVDAIEQIFEDVRVTTDATGDATIHTNHYYTILGTESPEYSVWRYAEYAIPSGAISLAVTGEAGQSARLWVLQDSGGTVLGYSDYSGTPTLRSETITIADYPTASKVFVNDKNSGNIAISYTHDKKAVDGNDVYINGENLPSILGMDGSDKLYGKVLCCVGDSITYGADMDIDGITNVSDITVYNCDANGNFTETTSQFLKTWGWQIANRHKMTFYNGGVSGSTMQGIADRGGFSLANGRYTKLPNNLDYLLIWFGWNDYAVGTLGTIDDTTNQSYYGGYNVVLPYLIDKYPYAKIGLIVPFGASAGHREAIRLLGNKWGIAVWDNYQSGTSLYYGKEDSVGVEASVVTANRTKFQANGAHPNYKGHTQLADMIEEWLKGI